jgi:hypothetical protein
MMPKVVQSKEIVDVDLREAAERLVAIRDNIKSAKGEEEWWASVCKDLLVPYREEFECDKFWVGGEVGLHMTKSKRTKINVDKLRERGVDMEIIKYATEESESWALTLPRRVMGGDGVEHE